ncbi:MAG: (4Fe-4S)-binding protein [Alphaproteobacteria bacterium]
MEEVRGKNLTIRYDAAKCIHSRYCVTGAPHLFVGNVEGDWIYPDAVADRGFRGLRRGRARPAPSLMSATTAEARNSRRQ